METPQRTVALLFQRQTGHKKAVRNMRVGQMVTIPPRPPEEGAEVEDENELEEEEGGLGPPPWSVQFPLSLPSFALFSSAVSGKQEKG